MKFVFLGALTLTMVYCTNLVAQDRVSGIETQHRSTSVKPGENFYQYVNEGWLKNTPIPADQSNYGSFSVLDDAVKEAIRNIIEQASNSKPAPGSDAQKVGDFFKSYTDIERRNALGLKPIQSLLDDVSAVKTPKHLAALIAKMNRLGIIGPFGVSVSQDAKKSDQYTVYVSQAGLTLPDRDYYLKDNPQFVKARSDLKVFIEDMLQFAGHENPKRAANNIYKLEFAIATIQWDRVKLRDPEASYNKHTAAELKELLSGIPADELLSTLSLAKQPEFIVRQPDYLKSINALLISVPMQAWKDYYTFRIMDAFGSELTEKIETRHFAFHSTALSGVQEQKPVWRRGVEACNGVLGEIVGKLYVEKHFPPEAKARMEQLVSNLKASFAKRIDSLDWMSPVTKQQAKEKLSKFNTKIGYPNKWKDYSKLEIKADDLVGNYIRSRQVEYQRRVERLGGPIDRDEWMMTPQTINAYYSASMNEIVFPAAILQPPFFNLSADDAVNYGGIGGVIGHELSHGFDDKGSQYDGDGNLRRWWSPEDRAEFERRAGALVKQYDGYKPFEDMNVNGKFTLGENIGDLGGMAVAYEAYKMSLLGKEAPLIDGLSGEQRFFMGWAQIWRRLYREPELRKRLVQDPHSPSEYRCNGILSNMDAFYECFGIKPGDPMYIAPENRVRIW
ncbi:MAG: M13 family metallopeptidase [Pirellulales bacterium]